MGRHELEKTTKEMETEERRKEKWWRNVFPQSKCVARQQLSKSLCLLAAGDVARKHQHDNNTRPKNKLVGLMLKTIEEAKDNVWKRKQKLADEPGYCKRKRYLFRQEPTVLQRTVRWILKLVYKQTFTAILTVSRSLSTDCKHEMSREDET